MIDLFRDPRFLMVTTVTSLSTLTSHFNCWVATIVGGALGCRKKRRSLFGKATQETEESILPSPAIQGLHSKIENIETHLNYCRQTSWIGFQQCCWKGWRFSEWKVPQLLHDHHRHLHHHLLHCHQHLGFSLLHTSGMVHGKMSWIYWIIILYG